MRREFAAVLQAYTGHGIAVVGGDLGGTAIEMKLTAHLGEQA